MNRYICVVFFLCSLLLTACGGTDAAPLPEETAPNTAEVSTESQPAAADWGITLTAESVTSTSLTIRCVQSGGAPTGELTTGSFYTVERKTDSGWEPVEYLPQEGELAWTTEAWLIPLNGEVTWDVSWNWLYGALPDGDYRIGKDVMDWRAPGDSDNRMVYAEFSLSAA